MSGQLRQCWYFMNTASEALRLLFREIKHTQFQMMLWGKEGLCISLCKSPVLGSRTLEVCQLSKQTLLELLRCWIVPGLFSVRKGRFSSQKCQNLSTEYLLYCSCIFLWEKKKATQTLYLAYTKQLHKYSNYTKWHFNNDHCTNVLQADAKIFWVWRKDDTSWGSQ